jgi:ferredoxin
VRVTVDLDLCASTGGCAQTCPEVFEIGDDGYVQILREHPEADLHDQVRDAADLCPTAAIELIES